MRESNALWSELIANRDKLKNVRGKSRSPVPSERSHFYPCEVCGQAVDKRDLFAVLHHEQPEHEPLPTN
jgi:hypothetical protein